MERPPEWCHQFLSDAESRRVLHSIARAFMHTQTAYDDQGKLILNDQMCLY